ncbi:uncharacterized protein LOC107265079 [Cephus cinctus]|uniref:Uncharacterized protein LOC107265079 n=1 Tax=Cephus cinctus TaxID=211228 RepID=A0AAJ7BMB9_CEPCN|nr:uncharacterized protein LOC107265079 [Cephus cinctus]
MEFKTFSLCWVLLVARAAGLPNDESFRVRIDRHHNAQFGEGIRDWFKNMKDRVLGQPDPGLQPDQIREMQEVQTGWFQDRLMSPGRFVVDLANVKFDPARDWGFRIGNWYFIRKSDSSNDFSYSGTWDKTNLQTTEGGDWIELDTGNRGNFDYSITTETTQPELPKVEPTLETTSILSLVTSVKEVELSEENETGSNINPPEAEVVIPKN